MAFLNSGTLPTEAPCTSNTPPQLPRRSKPDLSYQSVHVAHSAGGKTPESHSYNLCASVDRNTSMVRPPIVPLFGTHERLFVREYPKDHGTEFPCRGNCGCFASFSLFDSLVVVRQSLSLRTAELVVRRLDEHIAQPRRTLLDDFPPLAVFVVRNHAPLLFSNLPIKERERLAVRCARDTRLLSECLPVEPCQPLLREQRVRRPDALLP